MNENITIHLDDDVQRQMGNICEQLGMSMSTAFTLFAKAFVRMQGMPFPVTIQEPAVISPKQMAADANQILAEFAEDYRRMAE